MPLNRPNLTLDEQSFQGLLSAAFIIQQHNDRRKLAQQAQAEPEADRVCQHCGAPMPADASSCDSCGVDEFRPGERLQHNWASMWLISQEQSLWPERLPEIREAGQEDVPPLEAKSNPRAYTARDFAASNFLAVPVAATENETTEDLTQEDFPPEDVAPEDSDLTLPPFQLSAGDDSPADDSSPTGASIDATDSSPSSLLQRLSDLRVTLRFRRADLYLGAAVFVAALALLWPAAGSPRRAALAPWERALVTLGIAEAPAPVVHLRGDPGVAVWVDPHTALYYCPGEEPYGKTPDGRFSSQREAQMDRFEPASRSACE